MTPSEWELVCEDVRTRWGPSRSWAKADALWKDVTRVDRSAADKVILEFFGEARSRPPSISEVITAAREASGEVLTLPGPEECNHPGFAIVDEDDTHRLGVCRICGTEARLDKHRMLTEAELENRRRGSQRVIPPAPLADREDHEIY
ncbi:MAG: hypothetical protein DRQ39_08260 [Gammaproteobacteria bacterium]|nr:MAG: hypothetical protein DRQ39_08260 [Gammaproteobacteria bacterium]